MSQRQGAIQSMTGYGRASRRAAVGSVTVELRSTNHRYLEVDQRLPNGFTAVQGRLTELLQKRLRRGRVEVLVFVQAGQGDRRRVTFDERLLAHYYEALVSLKGRFGLRGQVSLDQLLALPQAVTVTEERLPTEELWEPIRQTAETALTALVRTRQREGGRLVADLRRQIRAIEAHARAIKARRPKALEQQRQQLRQRLRELLGAAGSRSVSQLEEVVALVRDADIHEELVRLDSHVSHMRQTLASSQLVGKQLDFIAQEL
ncbi:MAG: YicC/YloC family endoribonuclease, partial [Candidatus Omnitrophota bacterium]|nr:YicC/YloC family endoribonuclease [Candidatus Omnitrophota bacterium]